MYVVFHISSIFNSIFYVIVDVQTRAIAFIYVLRHSAGVVSQTTNIPVGRRHSLPQRPEGQDRHLRDQHPAKNQCQALLATDVGSLLGQHPHHLDVRWSHLSHPELRHAGKTGEWQLKTQKREIYLLVFTSDKCYRCQRLDKQFSAHFGTFLPVGLRPILLWVA